MSEWPNSIPNARRLQQSVLVLVGRTGPHYFMGFSAADLIVGRKAPDHFMGLGAADLIPGARTLRLCKSMSNRIDDQPANVILLSQGQTLPYGRTMHHTPHSDPDSRLCKLSLQPRHFQVVPSPVILRKNQRVRDQNPRY